VSELERGLICMGRHVEFVLHADSRGRARELRARRQRDGMLYDVSGFYWPACSLLIAPFENGRAPCDDVQKARDFFGRSTRVFEGHASLPSRSLNAWRELGEVDQVFYDRAGKHSGPFRHKFNAPRGLWQILWPFMRGSNKPAILYACSELGGCYRVELPHGCIVDDRGIVLP